MKLWPQLCRGSLRTFVHVGEILNESGIILNLFICSQWRNISRRLHDKYMWKGRELAATTPPLHQ